MTALAERTVRLDPTAVIRCQGCGIEAEVHGTSAYNDAPEGWQVDQITYYNPNGLHYCLKCSRRYWVAFCMGDDGKGNCGNCFGGMELSGLLVSAPVEMTEDQVLGEIQARDTKCGGGNKILGVEVCEDQEPSSKYDVEL